MKKILIAMLLILFTIAPVFAEQIGLVSLYGGKLENKTEINGDSSKDDGLMFGLYGQFINTELFQVNDFLYFADDINDSRIIGNHFIADFYPYKFSFGSSVIGAGYEFMNLDTDASSSETQDGVTATAKIERTQNLHLPYARVGQYINFGDSTKLSLLPWTGVGYQTLSSDGDVKVTFNSDFIPDQESDLKSDDSTVLWMNGINLGFTFERYLEVKFKYGLYYNVEDDRANNNFSVDTFAYLHRHFGIAYRMKYSESSNDAYTLYNLFGAIYVF